MKEIGLRFRWATEIAVTLYVCAFVGGLVAIGAPFQQVRMVGVLWPPAVAVLVFLALGVLLPGFVGPLRLRRLYFVTCPVAFLALVRLFVALSEPAETISKPRPILLFAENWSSPVLLASVFALQALALAFQSWNLGRKANESEAAR